MKISIEETKLCKICDKKFKSSRLKIHHVKKEHGLNFEEYIIKVYYNDIYPKCKCGCGTILSFKPFKRGPFFSEYTTNHFPRDPHSSETIELIKKNTKKAIKEKFGVENVFVLRQMKEKAKKTKLEKYGDENYNNMDKNKQTMLDKYGVDNGRYLVKNTKTSVIEKEVADKLNAEHKFVYKNKEFDIRLENDLIEIDGDFWHPDKLENLTLIQISSAINDKNKIDIINESDFNMYKIHTSNIPENISLDTLKENSYEPDYSISYYQKILTKEYFKRYIEKKGKDKLKKYNLLLLKFIRTFQKDFPYMITYEKLNTIIETINRYDMNRIIDGNIFKNYISTVGVNYLKSHFKSYWHSKYESNRLSPYEAWYDDDVMRKVIAYRIGINNSNEVFDFSLHQLIRGLAARRYTISFFKPLLAASIYKYFLGGIKQPIVIDPCAGFGGRMLGFKSVYPDGKYIGIEPNGDIYNELVKLSKKFNNVELYNCKLEDYTESFDCDLTFTSVPYYNNETYSNGTNIEIEEWKNMMKYLLGNYKNVLVNISQNSYKLLNFNYSEKYIINNNTSHFNQSNNIKEELLLKL